jgi:hypothetical protein
MLAGAADRSNGYSKPEVVAWAKSFVTLIDALHAYVKQYHTTGVKWNPKVSDIHICMH